MVRNIASLNAVVNSTDRFSAAYHAGMTRRDVLIDLIKQRFGGNQAEFARAIKKSPAQVNQWVSGYRNLGDAGARHIEITLGLPQGYFDSPRTGQGPMRAEGGNVGSVTEEVRKQVEAILPVATERSMKSLDRIIKLAKAGRLTDEDMEELARIAERFAR